MHLIPQHWNWPPGARVDVWAYTSAASAELFVNGESQGLKPQAKYSHLSWPNTSFAEGTLRVVGYDADGGTVAEDAVSTTAPAARLRASIKDGVGSSTPSAAPGSFPSFSTLPYSQPRPAWCYPKILVLTTCPPSAVRLLPQFPSFAVLALVLAPLLTHGVRCLTRCSHGPRAFVLSLRAACWLPHTCCRPEGAARGLRRRGLGAGAGGGRRGEAGDVARCWQQWHCRRRASRQY